MSTALHRPVCDLLGCTDPIVLAGMGGVARSELVAAVTEAGGFGFLGMVREPVPLIRSEVAALRARKIERFGVNLIPASTDATLLEAQVAACIELGVPVISLFWDLSLKLVARLRAAGIIVVCQVGSAAEAQAAEEAGAQVLIAQGIEAGGHVRGDCPLFDLLPEIAARTALPVLAAGGLADGADLAAVLSLGAEGAVFGTALIATVESFAHDYHKQCLVAASGDDTVLTDVFHVNWPRGAKVRVLANSVTRGARGDPFCEVRIEIGAEGARPIYLFSTDSPLRSMTGDFEAMALYAGTGVGHVAAITGAAERVRAIAAEAMSLLVSTAVGAETIGLASPACFAGEVDEAYMGFAAQDELLLALNGVLESERAAARVALRTVAEVPQDLKPPVIAIHRDAARWCNVLTQAIYRLHGTPSSKTSAAHDKAMALADVAARLGFLNDARREAVEKLHALLPKIRDAAIHADLVAMLASHQQSIDQVAAASPDPGSAGGG